MGIFSKGKKGSAVSQSSLGNLALNYIHDSVVIVDSLGNILLINPAAENLLGFIQSEVLGLNFASVIRLADKNNVALPDAQNPIAVSLRDNQYHEAKNLKLVRSKTGENIPIKLAVAPTDNANGRIVTMHDATKELEEESSRNDFISTASHEMRTPVASIEGYLALALSPQTATIDERARAYLMKAHEASQHLGKLFRDLLDVTKLDDGKMKAHFEPVEMSSLVKSIAMGMAPNVTAKGLQLILDDSIQDDPKKLKQIFYCSLDVDYLREILNNLIENAIKYTPTGSITIGIQGDPQTATVFVADTGIGISREDQKHVFQKFYRVDNSQTQTIGGTGLGLYIIEQRAEAMQGHINLESEPGKGSRFLVSFPRISVTEYEKQKLAETSIMKIGPDTKDLMPPEILQPKVGPDTSIDETATQLATSPLQTPTDAGVHRVGSLPPEKMNELKRQFAQSVQSPEKPK